MAYELVVMGASWGGLSALERVLGGLPRGFRTPIAVAQHRSADGKSEGLARLLTAYSAIPVIDVEDKQPIEPGYVYLAPPDYHLYVERDSFALSVDDAVLFSRLGGHAIVQNPAEAERAEMPRAALRATDPDQVLSLAAIPGALADLCGVGSREESTR
jgi:two-component system chemotaxis response regulator CheB